ncbi:DUF4173 domain-containing protein [Mycobacterium sp. ITM-2016-00316]|uniref:DUF4153 domain-containing protein n=1 Tax=Mycobacterium sp. ITM-2016-00316 TaxID=2099695 RepID=UPI000CF9EC4F|nr:DUF4173 domain-containing protein [Mycobacterium sp. ITM-2016-00316]WNG81469.1 DUF4173 domain-containing protein [Mycobacterium sp. ITM-2016-00316]
MTRMAPGAYPMMPPPMLGPVPPPRGVIPRRVWPLSPLASAPLPFVVIALTVGLIGTALWRPTEYSIGYLVVGVLVFAAVYGTAGRRPGGFEALGIAMTLALLAVPAVLAALWVNALCIVAAWLIGWHTLVGGRTWTAVVAGAFVPWVLPARVIGWVQRAAQRRVQVAQLGRIVLVGAITCALVLVFGGLFAGADPAFEKLVGNLVPSFDTEDIVSRTVVFFLVLLFVLGGGYLVRFPPKLDAMAPAPRKPVPRWEWAVPLAVLDGLFLAFVAVQATVLFGGRAHVLATEGLTYAEYARQGFWQLLWVSALTVLVIAVVIRVASRATGTDRRMLRILVGTLCATSIVVVISAIHRMWVYQDAYGFSTERLMVITIELWLGTVFVLIAAAGIRMSASWLPRAVLVAGVAALLGLAGLNPEGLIADRNIDRFERTGQLDAKYLSGLSSDIDPALHRLPDWLRQCVNREGLEPDPWYLFNLSRSRAADERYQADLPVVCEQYWPGFYR